jgi:hypothetical protein
MTAETPMPRLLSFLPLLLPFLLISPLFAETYYVDSSSGDDTSVGTSIDMAWRSIECVNEQTFMPGDRILFKSGAVYEGQLRPQGSGDIVAGEVHPIVIDSYGEGDPPRIDGGGIMPAAVHLHNVECWEIRNLEITNTGETSRAGRRGVLIEIEDFGTARHIQLVGLNIHDVNGSLVKKQGGGSAIKWSNKGRNVPSRFDGLLIESCRLARCERNGINSSGNTRRGESWFPSLNVVIRNNLLEEIPGDGIVPIGCDGAIVEYNVMRDCPRLLPQGEAAAGIWPWSSDNTVIQFNEVSDHKAPWDAQGFDSDWNCQGTVIQYNYSHDNEGGFLLICTKGDAELPSNIGNIGTVVRYNISVNDGMRPAPTRAKGMFSPTFHISGPCQDTKIYNNLILIGEKPSPETHRAVLYMDNWGGPWPEDTRFYNNIFHAEESTSWRYGETTGTVFDNNLYSGTHRLRPDDPNGIVLDAAYVEQAWRDMKREDLERFRPDSDSPFVGAGRIVPNSGGVDFSDASLPEEGRPTIGAFEPR